MRAGYLPLLAAAFATSFALNGAANAQGAAGKRLFFEGDMVRGAQQGAPGPFCVLSNQFKRLEKVVWRIRVLNEAGQPLDDSGLKSVVVDLPDGQKLNAKYRPASAAAQGRGHRPLLDGGLDHSGRATQVGLSPTRSRPRTSTASRRPGSRSNAVRRSCRLSLAKSRSRSSLVRRPP